jgi:serine/threonine protein phosphatase 1
MCQFFHFELRIFIAAEIDFQFSMVQSFNRIGKVTDITFATMRTLVMGDIHGAYRALQQCLARCRFDPSADRLIQLGDVVDRGPQTYECVEYLRSLPNMIALRGNHDDWFHDFITTGYHPQNWRHGGRATIESYGQGLEKPVKIIDKTGGACKTSLVEGDITLSHQDFFKNQQLHYIDQENNCFVHGGFERLLPFFEQPSKNYFWDRSLWLEAMSFVELSKSYDPKRTFQIVSLFDQIFLGHTPTTNWGTDKPMHVFNIWNLDTGAGHTGRLTVMDVDSNDYWQSDPVTELYGI